MTLVLKTLTQQAPEGAETLKHHRLVNSGTLLLYDFSNGGTTDNFDVSNGRKVHDLARQVSIPLGINNEGTIVGVTGERTLTSGKGYEIPEIENGRGGLDIGIDVFKYLYEKNPHSLLIFAGRVRQEEPTGSVNPYVIRAVGPSGDYIDQNNLRVNVPNEGRFQIRFGYGSIASSELQSDRGSFILLAIEVNGAGNPVKLYKNGYFAKEKGVSFPDGFTYPTYESWGMRRLGSVTPAAVYALSITDLTRTTKTAAELVRESWDYFNGTGEFSFMEPRPFIDAY